MRMGGGPWLMMAALLMGGCEGDSAEELVTPANMDPQVQAMLEGAWTTAAKVDRIPAQVAVYSHIARIQTEAGDAQGARRTASRAAQAATAIEAEHLRAQAYRVVRGIAATQAMAGDQEGMRQTAQQAEQLKVEAPDDTMEESPRRMYARAILRQADEKGVEAAETDVEGIGDSRDRAAMGAIVSALALGEAGEVEAAREMAATIDDAYERAEVYRRLAAGRTRADDAERVAVAGWLGDIEEPYPRAMAFVGAAEGLVMDGVGRPRFMYEAE